jgi:chaperonin GroEL (HSP60 family)
MRATIRRMTGLSEDIAARIDAVKVPESDDAISSELNRSLRRALAAMKKAAESDASHTHMSRVPWLLLLINLQMYGLFVRYFISRFTFFVVRSSFIWLVPILGCGVIYGYLSGQLTKFAEYLTGQSLIVVMLMALALPAFKRFCIDPYVRQWERRLEARRLAPLAFRLHAVRALALLSRIHARPTPIQAGT